jgi:hypothetical protein
VVTSLEGEAVAVTRALAGEAEPESTLKAAAEAVSARLQALYPEPDRPVAEAEMEAQAEAATTSGEPEPPAVGAAAIREPAADELADEAEEVAPRILIDDTAPYEFIPAQVQPLATEPGDGLLAIVALLVLGLAFFAGGVFWALNAQPPPQPSVLTPVLVGWLAGVAGVGFIAAAVFMLLQRMTRAAERRDRRGY